MYALIVFAGLFVIGHLTLSSLPVRARLIETLGTPRAFVPLYSLVALITFAGMVYAYGQAPRPYLWDAPSWLAVVPLAVMPMACWLMVEGLTRPNPGAVGQDVKAMEAGEAKAGFAVTRHPVMWGVALWALSHLAVNGDGASLVLMGAVLLLALVGSAHIDRRRAATLGADWRDLGWWRPALALVLYGGLLHLHAKVIGVSPLP